MTEDARVTRTGFSQRTLLTGAATVGGAIAASLALLLNVRKPPAGNPPRSFSPRRSSMSCWSCRRTAASSVFEQP